MPITPGQSLSFYEILDSLGVGAMGEVYRAQDTRLDREVAIKVLPEHFADDEDRLRRFEREAKSLASLNHPNVAQIYGVDQVGDTCFLVLELVPGETLEERLARGALDVDDAIAICCQIADGLEEAHEAGVIHRDLKPANVRITPDGKVKVLDFGLAKPIDPGSGSASATDSVLATVEGRLLGTPTYMAPEQARGKPIDRRVDLWAFGCVLYECLSAQRAFRGETLSDVLASVLNEEPDWTRLPAATPPHVRAVLARCLIKDPVHRLRDAGDAGQMLALPMEDFVLAAPPADRRVRRIVPWLLAGLVLGAGIEFLVLRPALVQEPEPISMESVHVPARMSIRPGGATALAISPDGETLAWVGGERRELHVRALHSFEVRVLPATENSNGPFFSPDSKRLGFWKEGALMSISLSGGTPASIAEVPGRTRFFRGASWGDDGYIVLSPSITSGLFRVPDSGGELEAVTEIAPDSDVRTERYPDVLPGSEVVLFTRDDKRTSEYHDDALIIARSLVTGEERVVVEGAGEARFAAGHIVFVRGADLYAQAFDPRTLSVSGAPRRIVSGVEYDTTTGAGHFGLALDGTLVYMPGLDRTQSKQLAWRRPGEQPDVLDLPPAPYLYPRVAPNGRFVSYILVGPDQIELWLYDLESRSTRRRLRQKDIRLPIWSVDSTRIYFGTGITTSSVLFEIEVDGTSAPRALYEAAAGTFVVPFTITPDGASILATVDYMDSRQDILLIDAASGASSELIATPSRETTGTVHPSGVWLAFTADRTGELQVYLTTLAPGGPEIQVSRDASLDPRWSPGGETLYFVQQGARRLWAVDVELGERPVVGNPRVVFDDFYWDVGTTASYDVAPDGRILSYVDIGGSELGREIRVQQAWLEEGRGTGR